MHKDDKATNPVLCATLICITYAREGPARLAGACDDDDPDSH